eukprot:scaffold1070_cov245-Pinguiococcus_pyrenoidosus.AAC.10
MAHPQLLVTEDRVSPCLTPATYRWRALPMAPQWPAVKWPREAIPGAAPRRTRSSEGARLASPACFPSLLSFVPSSRSATFSGASCLLGWPSCGAAPRALRFAGAGACASSGPRRPPRSLHLCGSGADFSSQIRHHCTLSPACMKYLQESALESSARRRCDSLCFFLSPGSALPRCSEERSGSTCRREGPPGSSAAGKRSSPGQVAAFEAGRSFGAKKSATRAFRTLK